MNGGKKKTKREGADTMANYFKMGFFTALGVMSAYLAYKIVALAIVRALYG